MIKRYDLSDIFMQYCIIYFIVCDIEDFLIIRALEREELVRLALKLLPYTAFRITYNIYVIPRFEKTREKAMKQLLDSIWENLNNLEGKNEEYFAAILQIVNNICDFKFTFDYRKANIDKWIESFEAISQNYPDEVMLLNLANTIAHLLYNIAIAGDIENTTKFLNGLTTHYNKYQTIHQLAFGMLVAGGLSNSVIAFGIVGSIDGILLCMTDLKCLSRKITHILICLELFLSIWIWY